MLEPISTSLESVLLARHRRGICQVLHEQIFCTTGALVFDYVLSLLTCVPIRTKMIIVCQQLTVKYYFNPGGYSTNT